MNYSRKTLQNLLRYVHKVVRIKANRKVSIGESPHQFEALTLALLVNIHKARIQENRISL